MKSSALLLIASIMATTASAQAIEAKSVLVSEIQIDRIYMSGSSGDRDLANAKRAIKQRTSDAIKSDCDKFGGVLQPVVYKETEMYSFDFINIAGTSSAICEL